MNTQDQKRSDGQQDRKAPIENIAFSAEIQPTELEDLMAAGKDENNTKESTAADLEIRRLSRQNREYMHKEFELRQQVAQHKHENAKHLKQLNEVKKSYRTFKRACMPIMMKSLEDGPIIVSATEVGHEADDDFWEPQLKYIDEIHQCKKRLKLRLDARNESEKKNEMLHSQKKIDYCAFEACDVHVEMQEARNKIVKLGEEIERLEDTKDQYLRALAQAISETGPIFIPMWEPFTEKPSASATPGCRACHSLLEELKDVKIAKRRYEDCLDKIVKEDPIGSFPVKGNKKRKTEEVKGEFKGETKAETKEESEETLKTKPKLHLEFSEFVPKPLDKKSRFHIMFSLSDTKTSTSKEIPPTSPK